MYLITLFLACPANNGTNPLLETIDADQVDDLMNRRKVREPRHWDKNDFDSSGGGASKAEKDADTESTIGGTVEDV